MAGNREHIPPRTVAIKSVLLSCVVDAEEKRDFATVNIPGAFMQVNMEDTVHMKLEGKMAELLVKLNPKLYRKYVQTEGKRQVLYMELKKHYMGLSKLPTTLEKAKCPVKEMGFHDQFVQLVVCCQQNDQLEAVQHPVAR
jgi:hypothetical protein